MCMLHDDRCLDISVNKACTIMCFAAAGNIGIR